MGALTRRRLLIVVPLVFLLLWGAWAVVLLAPGKSLQSRSDRITAGMPRAEVEVLLGQPELVLKRTGDRGFLLSWVDQFWQVDVLTDPDGQVESTQCIPSHSFYRGTVGRVISFP